MNDAFPEKSHRVMDVLAQSPEMSQREVAHRSGLSLGMVNLIVKRLVRTGHIKVSNLTHKKMVYILTPQGITERMLRSYHYFQRVYRAFHESQSRVETLLNTLMAKGHRKFLILGDGEVADLVAMLLLSRLGTDSKIRRSLDESVSSDEVALDCRLGRNGGPVGISVLEKLLDPTHHWLEEDAPRPLAVHS